MSFPIRHRLEYWSARVLAALVRLLPLRLGWALGAILGQLAFSIVRVRRRVTMENLHHAFSESRSHRELTKIGARCYRNLGRGLVEFCRFPSLTRRNLSRILEIEGLEHCTRGLAQGKGVIILSGHFGAWELLSPAFGLNGYPIDALVRSQRNPLADQLVSRHRRQVGIEIHRVGSTPRGVVRSLRRNHLVIILADQDSGRDGLFIPFLGRLASTAQGPARFAMETGAAVLMSFMVRQPGNRHRLIIHPPMEIPRSGNREEDLFEILQTYTRRLETYVRTYPEQWFWPHRRWKSRPPADAPAPPI